MAKKVQRIGLFGYFGVGNLGNEGSLEAMIRFLRSVRPDAELVCICVCPEKAHANHCVATIPIAAPSFTTQASRVLNRILLKIPRRLHEFQYAWREMRRLDAVLVPGTGILDDFGEQPHGMPYALFRWSLAAQLARRPFAFVSVGAGPILHPLSLRLMKWAARLATFRTYRDQISRDFMQSIGVNTSTDQVYPDIAFKLAHSSPLQQPPAPRVPLTVGIGVMDYTGWTADNKSGSSIHATYLEKITCFVLWLLQQGHSVRLLIGQQSDWPAVEEILKRVIAEVGALPQGRLVAEPAVSLHDLMSQMHGTDIVVATRFHNIVCALLVGKPSISLGYADKNISLLSDMGLGDFCQHAERFDVDLLTVQFQRLLKERATYALQIEEKILDYRKRLADQDARILREVI